MRKNNWKKGILIVMAGVLILGHITRRSTINATTYSGSENQEVIHENQETVTENQESAVENQETTTEKVNGEFNSSEEGLKKVESDDLLEEVLIQFMDTEASGTQAAIPETFAELNKSTIYMIDSDEGWLRLQNICNEGEGHSLEGYKFVYTVNSVSGTDGYDFSAIAGFEGLGAKVPFAGQLNRSYTTSIPLDTNKPIFVSLSSKAVINKMDIRVSGAPAGLSKQLVMDGNADSTFKLTDISVSGTVESKGISGGIFAEVINDTDYTLTIAGENVRLYSTDVSGNLSNRTVVYGKVAGGLIGSISGNVTIQLDDGISWAPVTEMKAGVGITDASVGGLIGMIKNETSNKDGSKRKVYITGTSIEYNVTSDPTNVVAGNRGGIVGSIENADVVFEPEITYKGKDQETSAITKDQYSDEQAPHSLFDLKAEVAGTLAGSVKNSSITMQNAFTADNVWMEYKDNTTNTNLGIGGLVGVMENSSLTAADSIAINELRVQPYTSTYTGSIGGLIGSMYDSVFTVPDDKNCIVNSFETYYTYDGTMGGAIGFYKVTDGRERTLANVTAKNLRLITRDKNDCIAGLIGDMDLGTAVVTISNCYVNKVSLLCYNAASLGVGRVTAATGGKLILENMVCISTDNLLYNSAYENNALKYFGGAIGIADADFEIIGDAPGDDSVYNSGFVVNTRQYYNNKEVVLNYMGGLIGKADNTQTNEIRKGTVRNVILGGYIFGRKNYSYEAFGGLFGVTAKGVSICLDGSIEQNGGTIMPNDGVEHSVEQQTTTLKQRNVGSVVGLADDSLIYLEEGATFGKSDAYNCNEIGNYGGVIRNGKWGEEDLLIQNHLLSGKISKSGNNYLIEDTADLMRLAIVLNTEGKFLPSGNLGTSIEELNAATYAITTASIDLTSTGVVCLNRNDETGREMFPFHGSLIGKEGSTTITNTVTAYSQSHIGLFSKIDGNSSKFENLSLNYSVLYDNLNSTDTEYVGEYAYFAEGAGGLAAVAEGNITVNHVSYTGKLKDAKNDDKYRVTQLENGTTLGSGEQYFKDADYFGGIFGEYKLVSGEQLIMDGIDVNMTDFSYKYVVHAFGGVIAYVNLDNITSEKTTASTDIDLKNINVSGTMSLSCNTSYLGMMRNSVKTVRNGSFIALIGNAETGEDFVKRCDISVQNLTVDGVKEATDEKSTCRREVGGFWGYKWTDAWIHVSASENKKNEVKNSTLKACSLFGALVNTVYGKMNLEDVSFGENVVIDTIDGAYLNRSIAGGEDETNCGLLVRDGRYLYLTVKEVIGTKNVVLQNYKGKYFDELVGFNRGGNDDTHGGIVSVEQENRKFLGRSGNDYVSYSDGMNTRQNPNTRYYYDLSTLTYPEDYAALDSADDIMAWHLMHYVNSEIRTCLDQDFIALPDSYVISGDIDMQGYSIYPTHSVKESYRGSGSITFHAAEIIAGEKAKTENTSIAVKYPENDMLQHYQMQSGLFDTVAGITVDGLTLKGTYSQVQRSESGSVDYAGALICGTIYGIELEEKDSQGKTQYADIQNTISNIVLDDLWCVSSFETGSRNYAQPLGLMIADIGSGAKVTFDKISMKHYKGNSGESTSDYMVSADNKAASSLIGNVGGTDARCITLKFTNMDVADAATGKSDTDKNTTMADEALAKASIIYSYEYAEKCNAIYTFNYDDYTIGTNLKTLTGVDKCVTLGIELGKVDTIGSAEIEYYDNDLKVGQLKEEETFSGIDYAADDFIPYVFTYNTNFKNLIVNPKAGNLTDGCGTYEDPYIIRSTKQLLTLYRYLYKEADYEDILIANEWKVNAVGYDDTFCDGTSSNHTICTYGKTDNLITFPDAERLSQAYYLICEDIDFSKEVEFTGFGSAEQPFIGVFVGRKTDGTIPLIRMSTQTASVPAYGFIQYAKGCVIKDLTFQYNSTVTIAAEGGIGGGVIATVLGGDNILDNVTVQGNTVDPNNNASTEIIPCFKPGGADSVIGGYVGMVRLGGVVIRNMKTSNLLKFKVLLSRDETESALTDADLVEKYRLTNGIIGKVEDGYVLDENSEQDTSLAVNAQRYPINAQLPASRSYDIVNKSYLDKMLEGNGKIVWKDQQYDIKGAAQLQVMSMALNAGVFNYSYSETSSGYSINSRTRSGAYSNVGMVASDADKDYKDAITYDNWNKNTPDDLSALKTGFFRAYLMQYFDFQDIILSNPTASYKTDTSLLLNPILNTGLSNVQTYNLSTDSIYDMSVYGTAFRGFGARYYRTNNVFCSHMKGNDAGNTVVKVDMLVDDIQSANEAAFLNTISVNATTAEYPLKISNLTLTGRVINAEDRIIIDNDGKRSIHVTRKEKESTHNAAGWISTATGFIEFLNVNLKNIDIQSQSFAGGYIAKYQTMGLPTFKNCRIQSDDADLTGTGGSSESQTIVYSNNIEGILETGGFIGWLDSNSSSGRISFTFNENAANTNILESVNVHSYGKYWNGDFDYTITENTKSNIYNTNDIDQPATGGLIGRVYVNEKSSVKIDGADLQKISVRGEGGSAGGLIGISDTYIMINENAGAEEDYQTKCQWLSVESEGRFVQTGGLIGAMKYDYAAGTSMIRSVFINNLSVKNTYTKRALEQTATQDDKFLRYAAATAGLIGATNFKTELSHVDIGSETEGTVLIEHENRVNGEPARNNTYGVGGFFGRCINKHQMTMEHCGIYGRKNGDEYTTVISAFGNSGAIAGNIRDAACKDVEIISVKVEGAKFVGGLCGYAETKNVGKNCLVTLDDFTVKDSYFVFGGNATGSIDDGDIGCVVGRGTGQLVVSGITVDGNRIDSDYCEQAAGLVGRLDNKLIINASENSSINNRIQNNLICGRTVGGVTGLIRNGSVDIHSITIQNNKLISSLEKSEPDDSGSNDLFESIYHKLYSCSGGVIGNLDSTATAYAEDVIIKENLISGYYDTVEQNPVLGGAVGLESGKIYFYHADLQNNYIGAMHKDDLSNYASVTENNSEEEQIALRKKWLWDMPIVAAKTDETSPADLRHVLYYVYCNSSQILYDKKIADTEIEYLKDGEGNAIKDKNGAYQYAYYQYCYRQGAVVGIKDTNASASYIRINIDYTDGEYRPVSDVGLKTDNRYLVTSNTLMYDRYRTNDVIVYDGYDTKVSDNTFAGYLNKSYPFGNLEEIWSDYQSIDSDKKRNAYRLDENYQKNAVQDISVGSVYKNTYKDDNGYLSDFKMIVSEPNASTQQEVTLPMVVYRSNDGGSIDNVIQTYINMITNNSGALNSCAGVQTTNNNYLINVTTAKYKLTNGVMAKIEDEESCISVTSSITTYKTFEFSLNGYDQFVDSLNGTFSVVTVQYLYGNDVKWEFEIPVYVEPMLQIESHMSMLEGIQYDIDEIKTKGTQSEEDIYNEKILSSGNSYSLYLEYIYGETRKHYPNAAIPKQFYMEDYNDDNNQKLKFMSGTRLTLIAIDEGSRPYYYTVSGDKEIDKLLFTDFKDSNGNSYQLKNINTGCPTYENGTTFTDLHKNNKQEVAVEQYLIIVDLSKASARDNSKYRLRITPEALSNSDNEADKVLSARIDYDEHCNVYFNEIPGITYSIDDTKTTITSDSKISNNGKITLNMSYIMQATYEFWSNNKNNPFTDYLDVAIYLKKGEQKVALPTGTQVQFNNQIYPVTDANTSTIYYYKDSNSPYQITGAGGIVDKTNNDPIHKTLSDIIFDFSGADLSGLENGTDYKICVDLVVAGNPDSPADGNVKDSCSISVPMEGETDIGFALQVKDQRTLGMNGYQPESTDSGIVSYTASIAFPAACQDSLEAGTQAADKYYTIVYQVYEKTKFGTYIPYTGNNVSVYLGDVAGSTTENTTVTGEYNSGDGITVVTYKFTQKDIMSGAVLSDGLNAVSNADATPAMIQTNCTLVADRDKLDMTNYKVEAYLLITSALPNDFTTPLSTANGCVQGYKLRNNNEASAWKEFTEKQKSLLTDTKNDFFVFTVARIKTGMQ